MKVFTIGYEGATMESFLAALEGAGVRQVIDVRQLPLSRRPGFSKATLAVYAGQLDLPEAQAQAAQMRALIAEAPSALLCFERDPAMCHRTLLIAAEGEGAEVVDLIP